MSYNEFRELTPKEAAVISEVRSDLLNSHYKTLWRIAAWLGAIIINLHTKKNAKTVLPEDLIKFDKEDKKSSIYNSFNNPKVQKIFEAMDKEQMKNAKK